jgi:hypothetical protein
MVIVKFYSSAHKTNSSLSSGQSYFLSSNIKVCGRRICNKFCRNIRLIHESCLSTNVRELCWRNSVKSVKNEYKLGFEVLTAVALKISVFWDIRPCSPIKTNISEEHTVSLKMEAIFPTNRRLTFTGLHSVYRRRQNSSNMNFFTSNYAWGDRMSPALERTEPNIK